MSRSPSTALSETSDGLRLFLAINLTPEVRRDVADATAALREAVPELAWVREHLLHLTLKFLGDQTDERAEELRPVLQAVAGRHRTLAMTLGGIGAFPNFRRARVVWLGVEQDPRLELLHHDVEVACEALKFEVEGRPFRPHLTLARVRDPLVEDRARALSREAKRIKYHTEFVVHSIDLMRSDLSADGPSYTTLVSAAFRST
jgi:RNA 2',3'-cyclic 3'-phosphodiesterase